ncbi:hypothetical protein KR059_000104 [Drosophila kikkawai]|nr:hypothetical protein KR059_000104 [Drosophila kikkawai]
MSWPGKLLIIYENFTNDLPPLQIGQKPTGCPTPCSCKCKCCRGFSQKYVAFNGESDDPSSSAASGGDVQKMMRFRSADMLLLLQAAQLRDHFWTNQYFKVDLQEDYAAISEVFAAQKINISMEKLAEILDTVTSGYRRAISQLTTAEAQGALRPKKAGLFFPGLRCSCSKCEYLPWRKLQDVEDHQKEHRFSDNFHCRICYRRFYLQHSLTAHLIRKIGGRRPSSEELMANESYKKLLLAQRSQELEEPEQAPAQVEDIVLAVPKHLRLDYEEENRSPIRGRIRLMLTLCPLCDQEYRFSFSHQLHFMKNHKRTQSDPETFPCYNCNRSFLTRKSLRKHQKRVRKTCHLRYHPFKCPKCRSRFQLAATRNSHVARIHDRKKLCLICKVPTVARCCSDHTPRECREAIKKHREKVRELRGLDKKPQAPKPMCQHCDQSFPNTFLLREHLNKKHLQQRNFTCEICGAAFYSQGKMQVHRKAVHLMMHVTHCETCNLTIKAKDNYLRHCRSKRHQDELRKMETGRNKTREPESIKKSSLESDHNEDGIDLEPTEPFLKMETTTKSLVKGDRLSRKPKRKPSTAPCSYQQPEKVNFCDPCGTTIVGTMIRHNQTSKHKNNLLKHNEKRENKRFMRN